MSIEVGKRTAIACDAVMICPQNYIGMSPELLPEVRDLSDHRD